MAFFLLIHRNLYILRQLILWSMSCKSFPQFICIFILLWFLPCNRRGRWHPTPVLLPGKSHGWRGLVGCSPWGRWVRHDWVTSLSLFTFTHWRRKWQPTRVLAWRIPGTGEPGGLPSMGSHRVGHDWSDLAAAAAEPSFLKMVLGFCNIHELMWNYYFCRQKWLPTSTFVGFKWTEFILFSESIKKFSYVLINLWFHFFSSVNVWSICWTPT